MTEVVFKINGKEYTIGCRDGVGPTVSLNEFIRSVANLRGTKSMCHEGGCGACVVAVRALHPISSEMKLFAVNSCLVCVLSCHGWEITTVEGLGNRITGYHDIQKRLANFNGTQCGYCTPGWVMNMYSLYESHNHQLTSEEIENSFAGNICRCTGYRPIADAFKSFATDASKRLVDKVCDLEDLGMFNPCGVKCSKKGCKHKKADAPKALLGKLGTLQIKPKVEEEPEDWCVLEKRDEKMIVIDCGQHVWYKAYTLAEVFQAISIGTDYKLIAGNTGRGVYHVTDHPRILIDIFDVAALKGHSIDVNLILGACMSLTEMMDLFLTLSSTNEDFSYLKQFHDHMDLVAHIPVRNIGTIGGNLFLKHGEHEFQSDLFLIFETVGGMITIASSVTSQQTISLIEFLTTDMTGKIIVNVMLPPLSQCCSVKTYKIMPRAQNAHAAVNAGFLFKINETTNLIERASIVYSSISETIHHATNTEALLVGRDLFTEGTLQLALKSLDEEIIPEDAPPEPSVTYRKQLAIALFYKAILYLCPDSKLDRRFRSGGEVFKRSTSHGTQTYDTNESLYPLGQAIPKLEALVQCAGEATFANDLKTQSGEVFGALVLAHATPGSIIESYDASEALALPGVLAFYSAADLPGSNTFTPTIIPFMTADEEIFCSGKVLYNGQVAGVIVANKETLANKAATLVKIIYSSISQAKPLLNIDDVFASDEKETRVIVNTTVEPTETGTDINTVIHGEYKMEGQYHYTMETQTCVTKPTEDGLEVHSATQWLDLTNVAIAKTLNIPVNSVNVVVRRLGGAYGAKISRATQIACASALVTHLLGKVCRIVLPLMTNMNAIGMRVPVNCNFEVGVNSAGKIQYLKNFIFQDTGCSLNESMTSFTIVHSYNCYDHTSWYIQCSDVLTDIPSTTWCRAPGSTDGVAIIEYIMERIAFTLGLDPIEVRRQNLRSTTVSPITELIETIQVDSNYEERKTEIKIFNDNNRWRKRAIKLLPLTYDLLYLGNFNAIVSIYHGDGTVVIIHGGIEMGQGINTKVAQVCAHMLGAPLEKVSVKPSTSFTSPNQFVTGASIGSECVAYATIKACETLLARLEPYKQKATKSSWEDMVSAAYNAGIDLQASYMYSTNDPLTDYEIFAVVVLEVEIDILTGNHDIIRVDLIEDVGMSMSPEVDVGQIEGAFVMGLGYWTSEKMVYNPTTGALLTNRTWTYKPPGIKDIPADMRIYFRRNATNPSGVLQSKATGEPASCLSVVVTYAIREAVRAARLEAGHPDVWFEIPNPCTLEEIFLSVGHELTHFTLGGPRK